MCVCRPRVFPNRTQRIKSYKDKAKAHELKLTGVTVKIGSLAPAAAVNRQVVPRTQAAAAAAASGSGAQQAAADVINVEASCSSTVRLRLKLPQLHHFGGRHCVTLAVWQAAGHHVAFW